LVSRCSLSALAEKNPPAAKNDRYSRIYPAHDFSPGNSSQGDGGKSPGRTAH
jgi:hypothetical protein